MVINESGLYGLILSSKFDSAKRFKRWVTSEVLPQIRKTGGYVPIHDNQGRQYSDEEIMARALQISQCTIEQQQSLIDRQQQTIEQQQPKSLFYDCVVESDDTCSVAEMAKIIEANGYLMGQKRLFEWLRNNGYLCTRGGVIRRKVISIQCGGERHPPDGVIRKILAVPIIIRIFAF